MVEVFTHFNSVCVCRNRESTVSMGTSGCSNCFSASRSMICVYTLSFLAAFFQNRVVAQKKKEGLSEIILMFFNRRSPEFNGSKLTASSTLLVCIYFLTKRYVFPTSCTV